MEIINQKLQNDPTNIKPLKGYEIICEAMVYKILDIFGKNSLLSMLYQTGAGPGEAIAERIKKVYNKEEFGILEAVQILFSELKNFYSIQIKEIKKTDEMMSIVLGLSHFIAIVSADTLLSFDELKQTRAIGGITYKMLLTLVESVISEDPELYASLQMSLPGVGEVEKLFQSKAKAWAEMVTNEDRQQFIQRMTVLKNRLEQDTPDFGKAYEDIYRIVEGL